MSDSPLLNLSVNTDSQGRPQSIQYPNEQYIISGARILLNNVPDSYYKLNISNMFEIGLTSIITTANQFKVNYDTSEVFFHSSKEGQLITINSYYGRGKASVNAKRVSLQDASNLYISTNVEDFATEMTNKANLIDVRVNNIVANAGSSNTEIVDARLSAPSNKTYSTLKLRLDNEVGLLFGSVIYAENYPIQTPEANDNARLQRAITAMGSYGVLFLSANKIYNVTSLVLSGRITIVGNNAKFNSVASTNTAPMLINNGYLDLDVQNLNFYGSNVAIQNAVFGGDQTGLKTKIYNCYFNGIDRTANAIMLRQNDFTHISDCEFWKVDTAIRVESDWSLNERDNTQIHLKNLNMQYLNLGLYLRQLDKATLEGVDISFCGSGIMFARDNQRINLTACHVEHYGNSSYQGIVNFGYGYYLPNNWIQEDITFDNCTAFLPDPNAVRGIYLGYNGTNSTNVMFRNCYVDIPSPAISGYLALELLGSYVWEGRFLFDNSTANLVSTIGNWTDGVIRETGQPIAKSSNLLPFSRIYSGDYLTDEGSGSQSFSVATDPDGIIPNARILTLTCSTQYLKKTTVDLKKGWHTMLVNGYNKTGTAYAFVMLLASPFTLYLQAQIKGNSTNGQIYRLPFYMPINGQVKVGLMAYSTSSCVLSHMELHRGFVEYFSDDPTTVKYSTMPTTGVWDVGSYVKNTSPIELGTSGSKYFIKGWECVGTPATFLQDRALTGN